MKLSSKVTGGRLLSEVSQKIAAFIQENEGKELTIEVKKKSKRRSVNQNAYFHGVILPLIAKEIGIDKKRIIEMDALKATLCEKFLDHKVYEVPKILVIDKRYSRLMVPRGTSDLSTIEFEGFCLNCRDWAESFLKIRIPEPNENAMMALEE